MIALTQEKREDLLAYGIAMIADAKVNGNQIYLPDKYIYLMKIALAALTAGPVLYAVDSDVEDKIYTALCNEHEDGSYPLFTAPPVPVIKLPSDSAFDSWFKSIEAGDDGNWQEPAYQSVEWYQYLSRRQLAKGAFNFYADEIKRLNGLGE